MNSPGFTIQRFFQYTRVNAPQLTSESEYETHIQMLRAFALVAHLNNTRLDVCANELLVDSAQLRQSIVNLFRLIDVELSSATPSTVEQVIQLSQVVASDINIYIPEFTRFSTQEDDEVDQVVFEVTEDLGLGRTDEVDYVYGLVPSVKDTDGVLDSNLPTRFNSVAAPFAAGDVGKQIVLYNCQRTNGGVFTVSNFIDASNIELSNSNFVTETAVGWILYDTTVNFATEANSPVLDFSPWGIPVLTVPGQFLYVGHDDIQWIATSMTFTSPGNGYAGVWEYYDPTFGIEFPSSLVQVGGTIEFVVDSLLGTTNRVGSLIQVTYNLTGVSEYHLSTWGAPNNEITTKSLLGQSVMDTNPLNYSIKAEWLPLPDQIDGTAEMTVDGDVEYSYPSTPDNKWEKAIVNNNSAYFVRYRVVEVGVIGAPPIAPPTIQRLRIDEEEQYFPFTVLQGETVNNEVVGGSNGQPDQIFTSQIFPVFDGSEVVEVDETSTGNWIEWGIVGNFVSSGENDRHVVIRKDDTGFALLHFGNGEFGKIPQSGVDNVRLTYRVGGEENGNVGSNMILDDIDGVSLLGAMGNPMTAIGWKVKDGGTEADLDRIKDDGPASIRNQGKAVTPDDTSRVAINEYVTENGSSLVARAFSVEEALGPKTIELVVVGTGGGFLTPEQIEDLEVFFNGDRYSIPEVEGVLLMNHLLTAVNYNPRPVDVTVNVIGTGLVIEQIDAAIREYLDPLAVDDEGNYIHDFGGELAVVKLDCAIDGISSNIKDIVRTVPATNVTFGPRQLPIPGTITVTITEP